MATALLGGYLGVFGGEKHKSYYKGKQEGLFQICFNYNSSRMLAVGKYNRGFKHCQEVGFEEFVFKRHFTRRVDNFGSAVIAIDVLHRKPLKRKCLICFQKSLEKCIWFYRL